MYHSQINNSSKNKQSKDEVEVTVRNLPNQVKTQEIVEYFSIAGPIKSSKFVKEEQRYSATIIYQDPESAFLCKKHIGDQYYKGRVLTITVEVKKNYPNGSAASFNHANSTEEQIAKEIMAYTPEQKRQLLSFLKNLRGPEEIFGNFLNSKPKIVSALLGKYAID